MARSRATIWQDFIECLERLDEIETELDDQGPKGSPIDRQATLDLIAERTRHLSRLIAKFREVRDETPILADVKRILWGGNGKAPH